MLEHVPRRQSSSCTVHWDHFCGFYPRFYWADSKGFWGSGTHHMSVGSCQGGRVCNSGYYGMFLCFDNGSTCGTYIPMIKAGSVTSGNVYVCLPGFHHLVDSVQSLAVRCSPSLNVPAVTVILSLCTIVSDALCLSGTTHLQVAAWSRWGVHSQFLAHPSSKFIKFIEMSKSKALLRFEPQEIGFGRGMLPLLKTCWLGPVLTGRLSRPRGSASLWMGLLF